MHQIAMIQWICPINVCGTAQKNLAEGFVPQAAYIIRNIHIFKAYSIETSHICSMPHFHLMSRSLQWINNELRNRLLIFTWSIKRMQVRHLMSKEFRIAPSNYLGSPIPSCSKWCLNKMSSILDANLKISQAISWAQHFSN